MWYYCNHCYFQKNTLSTQSASQFSSSVVSDSLRPHGLQHARHSCPSPTPGVYSNSCPLSRWCHPTISSSVVPFFPAFNLSQHQGLFKWVSSLHQVAKVLRVLASASVLPMKSQDWSPLGWIGWISLQSKGLSRVFSNTTVQKHQFFGAHLFIVQLSHVYMTTGKTIALTTRTLVGKVMSLLFNMLSSTQYCYLIEKYTSK